METIKISILNPRVKQIIIDLQSLNLLRIEKDSNEKALPELTQNQKEDLDLSYLESEEENSLIDNSVVTKISVVDVEAFGNILKSKDYGALKLFVMEHSKKMGKTFFSKMFTALEPMVADQSSPVLVKILGENQKHFSKIPDTYIFWLNICVQILIEVDFK